MLIALLAVNLETSDKVTGQPWHLEVFKCTSEHSCYPKSFIFSWNQPVTLLTCTEVSFLRLATRGQQRPTFGTHTILYRLHQKFCSLFTIRCHDRDSFHFLPNNRTEQLLDNVVTVCSTALCHLSSYFTVPSSHNIVLFQTRELFQVSSAVSREGKFLSNKRNSQRPN